MGGAPHYPPQAEVRGKLVYLPRSNFAEVVKLVYTLGLGPSGGNPVEVRVLSPAPEQNLTAFSKPKGGTREARPTDFPPFFQTNSDSRLRRDGGFFRQEAGAKSEAILTNFALPEIQKEFLLL